MTAAFLKSGNVFTESFFQNTPHGEQVGPRAREADVLPTNSISQSQTAQGRRLAINRH